MKRFSCPSHFLLLMFVLIVVSDVSSVGKELKSTDSEIHLSAVMDDADLAAGIVNAGELQLTVFNNGLLATWGWSFHIIPVLPAGWYKGYGYVPDMNVWIGAPEGSWTPKFWDPEAADSVSMGPTVSEAQLHGGSNQSDWGPTPGSLGALHSGNALVKDIVMGSPLALLPLVATSTIPASWPLDEGQQPHWPGPWGIDPETGSPSEGTFVSDQDLFFSLADGPYAGRDDLPDQGYPLDIHFDISVHAFDHPYEDFIIYSAAIMNNSSFDYTGLYIGVFFDADIPEYNATDLLNDRFDWVGSDRDLELSYIYDYRWGTGEWPDEDPEAYKVHAGIQFLRTPHDLGLTDWHWFEWERRPGVVVPERQERIQFSVLSGDTSDLVPAEWNSYFHRDGAGQIDPHFDSYQTVPQDYPNGFDCTFLMSSGPFDLPAADTTSLLWALVLGDDLEDLRRNARLARELSENRLVRIHPKVENVQVEVTPIHLDTSQVTITVKTYDRDGIFNVTGYVRQAEGNRVDSLLLFDDGLHSDGAAGDSVYGNHWDVTSSIREYDLDILSVDSEWHRTLVEGAASFWAGLGVLPPFDLRAEGQEEKIYASWSPTIDPATSGYHIYYDTDGPDPPYLGTDANQGHSPIAIPFADDSTFVLSGLQNGLRYYLTITAFDGSGRESGFPEGVSAVPGTYRPPAVIHRCLSRDNAIEVDWSAYRAIAPADVRAFHVFRSTDVGLNYTEIAAPIEMGYLDATVTNGLPYLYRVSVEDSAGNERHSGLSILATPVPETSGFPLDVGGDIDYFGATVVDINDDGENEIIVSSRDGGGYALHLLELDGSEVSGWPQRFDFSAQMQLTTRAVGDVDGDGEPEIVAGSADYEYERTSGVSIYAWHRDGRPVSGWPQSIPDAYYSAVALGDLDGDGDLEIVAGTTDSDLVSGAVYIYHHHGSILPGWPKVNDRFGFTHPSISDLDGDGSLDVLFASDSLYVWDAAGASLPGWPRTCKVSYNSPNIGDIDADGDPEVVVASLAGTIYAWERDGTLIPGWPVVLSGAFSYYTALGDIDGDGNLEFVVPPFLGGGLSVLNDDGSFYTAEPIEVPAAQWYAFPRIADVDGREDIEIVAEVQDRQTGAFYLYAWRLDGTPVYGWPISTFGSNYDATLCDIDNDGSLDIVTAQGPYVMSYTFGAPYDPTRIEWATTHHDQYQTNAHGFEPLPTEVMITGFSALGDAAGVQLRWSLSATSDIIGFSILRANMVHGPFEGISNVIHEDEHSYRLLDTDVAVGFEYYYMLEVTSFDDGRKSFGPISVQWNMPTTCALFQNYPNPFNPNTAIRYRIASEGPSVLTTLNIYNVLGQEIRTLVDTAQHPGQYSVTWDGRDDDGLEVSSGIYFFHLSVDKGQWFETKSMVLLR